MIRSAVHECPRNIVDILGLSYFGDSDLLEGFVELVPVEVDKGYCVGIGLHSLFLRVRCSTVHFHVIHYLFRRRFDALAAYCQNELFVLFLY